MADGWLDVWTPLTPAAYARRRVGVLPYPLDEPDCRLYVRAAHALYAGVSALGLVPGDQVLVPVHHDAAQVDALARAGVECRFYGVTADLEPDPAELTALAGPRCRALYLVHPLGFPRDAVGWRRWCDDRGLLLIEDASQAWLATVDGAPVGSHGDLAVYCLSNVLPLPQLAAAVSRPANLPATGPRAAATEVDRVVSLHHAWAASRSWPVGRLSDRAEAAPSLGDPTVRPGPLGSFLLPRLAGGDPARARRENYRLLLEHLGDLVPAPFNGLPEGAAPMVLPVEVSDRSTLVRRLADRRVRCLDLSAPPHRSVPADRAAIGASRREHTVGLPVHQRLTTADLDRIAGAVRPAARSADQLRVEHVDDLDGLDALRAEWAPLALQTRNIFASWEWHRTWWDHFGAGGRLAVTILRDSGGALRAVLPLYLWKQRPLRVARFIGNTAGDQLGPICAPGDELPVGRAIRELVRDANGWDLVLGEQLPADSAWGKRLAGRTVSREGSPVVRFRGSWEETTRTWSRRLRKELRRDERRLRADHEVEIRTVAAEDDLETDLDAFFELHRARWPRTTRFEQREAFHRDFARLAMGNGWLRLRIAAADGDPIAARLGFRYHGVESGYQSGWDEKYARYSLGILLAADTIRAAHADGMREYRFLRGGETYKYRFANADPGLETVLLSRPATAGLATAGAAFAGTAVPRYLRSVLDGEAASWVAGPA